MSIKYDGLFRKLKENGITKTGLQKSLKMSSTTLAKLSKNEYVSLKIIDDICRVLDCQPSDIIEYVPAESYLNSLISKLRSEKRSKITDGIYGRIQTRAVMEAGIAGKFTYEQIREMYDFKKINTMGESVEITDIIAITNHFRCMDYLIEHVREPLSIEHIRILFRIYTSVTYLNRKIMKLEAEFIIPEKKYRLEELLRKYEAIPEKQLENIITIYRELMKLSPLFSKNREIFGLICFKETLRNNIDPLLMDSDIEANIDSEFEVLHRSFAASQESFKKIIE